MHRNIGFYDVVTGYYFTPVTCREEIFVISEFSHHQFGRDSVSAEIRLPWWIRNPLSIWVGKTKDGIVRIVIQILPLSRAVTTIWKAGRVREADKVADDILGCDEAYLFPGSLEWYAELIAFVNDPYEIRREKIEQDRFHDLAVLEAFMRNFPRILKTMRPKFENDVLAALPICFQERVYIQHYFGLRPIGVRSGQHGYPLLKAELSRVSHNCGLLFPNSLN